MCVPMHRVPRIFPIAKIGRNASEHSRPSAGINPSVVCRTVWRDYLVNCGIWSFEANCFARLRGKFEGGNTSRENERPYVQIRPPQLKFLFCQQLPRTLQPSELVILIGCLRPLSLGPFQHQSASDKLMARRIEERSKLCSIFSNRRPHPQRIAFSARESYGALMRKIVKTSGSRSSRSVRPTRIGPLQTPRAQLSTIAWRVRKWCGRIGMPRGRR